MYYPIQIPYILTNAFSEYMAYSEMVSRECLDFVICFWKMIPQSSAAVPIRNIIVADGCIDLVVNYDDKEIGFSGMSKTEFSFIVNMPKHFMGARLAPGAFHQLTGLSAGAAMDAYLPVESVWADFDRIYFFSLPFAAAQAYLVDYFSRKAAHLSPNSFTKLFHTLFEDIPYTTQDLCQLLHVGPRQCQRIFAKHYGISPKMALSILRFQKALQILTAENAQPSDPLSSTCYYDQPHFIRDFKKNIGITPLELIRAYQK